MWLQWGWPPFSALASPKFGPCSPAIWNLLWLLGWDLPLLPLSHHIGWSHVVKGTVPFCSSQLSSPLLLYKSLTLTQLSCRHLFGKASLVISDCVSFFVFHLSLVPCPTQRSCSNCMPINMLVWRAQSTPPSPLDLTTAWGLGAKQVLTNYFL